MVAGHRGVKKGGGEKMRERDIRDGQQQMSNLSLCEWSYYFQVLILTAGL